MRINCEHCGGTGRYQTGIGEYRACGACGGCGTHEAQSVPSGPHNPPPAPARTVAHTAPPAPEPEPEPTAPAPKHRFALTFDQGASVFDQETANDFAAQLEALAPAGEPGLAEAGGGLWGDVKTLIADLKAVNVTAVANDVATIYKDLFGGNAVNERRALGIDWARLIQIIANIAIAILTHVAS